MRNLKVISYQQTSVLGDLPLTASAWDASDDSIICAFGPTPSKPIIELKRKAKHQNAEAQGNESETTKFVSITSWDAPCPLPSLECDEILLMHYFPDTLTVCLVLAGGDLVLVREAPEDGQERIEIVGSVDDGIAAAAWAPDEELLAVVTRADNLVLMSRDLEPVTESTMTADDLQASKHVSVGWGKKETQFQGKRAKAMRDPTMPEHVDEGLPSPNEDGRVNISWRGDGAYVAVNAVVPDHRRAIRVYSREGTLDSISEPVDGLESALSWRPIGNLIASIKRSQQGENVKVEVVFFERNGLRHGEFALRIPSSEIATIARQISLAWNIDSTVLAVSFLGTVQYWTMGNYHYYLKQEVKVSPNTEGLPVDVVWHPERPLKTIAGHGNSLVSLEYLSNVNRGSTIQPTDYGVVAVINGSILKLTPLRHAGVPPPMSFCDVETGSNIIDVAINRSGQRIAILQSTGIVLCEWQMRDIGKSTSKVELRHTTNVIQHKVTWDEMEAALFTEMQPTQIAFQSNSKVAILAPAQGESSAVCVSITLKESTDSSEGQKMVVSGTESLDLDPNTQTILTDIEQESVWAQNIKSTMLVSQNDSIDGGVDSTISDSQPNSAIFKLQSNSHGEIENGYRSTFHKVSLTAKGSLLADHKIIARDCTSFILTDLHLIYTTAQHLLKFVYLTEPDKMDVPGDTPEVDERCRSIERGAKIVTVIPSTYAVVLQMPRGNLESIYPRVLVLNGIRDSLRNLEYRTAFLACQNHQVDMNILHDYLPDVFMANVKTFIEDLKKPGRVDEFLSKLKEEDVTQTLYKDTFNASIENDTTVINGANGTNQIPSASRKNGSEKVNSICDAFISILHSKPGKFLQCIITAHVCKRPPDLRAGLTLVSSLRQTSTEEADLAVSHLCFLSDPNRLYDAALALYDLELALLVAQNAQRDPREYMPFLQNLQSLPLLRRQYHIDNHLRNYAKALISLHALEAHDEVEAFTIKHILYTNAMDLYKYSPAQLSKITNLYAEHLASQSQHSAAATLYESLNNHESACPLYALAHQWREALTCATLIPLPQAQLQQLATSLATSCAEESRDYRSAAAIHTDYLSDPSTAARLLCKGSYFAEATRLLALHNLAAQIPHTIDTALGEKVSEMLELVADCKTQLSAQVPRILELRVKKAEDPLAFYGGNASAAAADGLNIDIPDNVSLAATDATTAGGQSLFTRYGGGSQGTRFGGGTVASNVSRKTSRTKRREERKRARGKKGSVYEEEYLVASVARLIERVNGVHEEVGRLVAGLLRRGMRERAERVGEVMLEIVDGCVKAKAEVWGADEVKDVVGGEEGLQQHVGVDGTTEYQPRGADGVFWDSVQGDVVKKKEAPVVKVWKENMLVSKA